MTLILTMASSLEVLHVSDRQVTFRETGIIHSPVENKTIILVARDTAAVFGYTGSAYVNGRSTDEWLAEIIAERPVAQGLAQTGGRQQPLSLNRVLWRIREALRNGALPAGGVITIAVAGFRRRRGRATPFLAEISWPPTFAESSFHMRRPRSLQQTACISSVGDPPGSDELMATIREGAAAESSVRAGLVKALRRRATQSDWVGPNLMAVRICHPSIRRIEWEFLPAERHEAVLRSPDREVRFEAYHSPWIITERQILAPAVGTGHFTIQARGWIIEPIERPNGSAPSGILFAVTRQDRVPAPGSRRLPTRKTMRSGVAHSAFSRN
jgi:hypothetical protein